MENYITQLEPDLKNITISLDSVKHDKFTSIEDYKCLICDGLVYDSVKCSTCETLFCDYCISSWLKQDRGNSCPICRNFSKTDLSKIERNTLNKFILICPFGKDNCNGLRYEELKPHIYSCEYYPRQYECICCRYRCTIDYMADHFRNCGEIPIQCKYCKKAILRKLIESHSALCGVTCGECGKDLVKADYDPHKLNECAKFLKAFYENKIVDMTDERIALVKNHKHAIDKSKMVMEELNKEIEYYREYKVKYDDFVEKEEARNKEARSLKANLSKGLKVAEFIILITVLAAFIFVLIISYDNIGFKEDKVKR
jgi:hypothetical protein